ncbi:MAG: PVC-type heme-binding CxxCH protein [Pirellulaceae bacterium]
MNQLYRYSKTQILMPYAAIAFGLWAALQGPLLAQDEVIEPNEPQIEEESNEAELALNAFKIVEGVTGKLFAAEPLFANPVAFYVADDGRVFVCETFRQGIGVVDNRNFDDRWVDADLAAQTVEDRRKYHLEQLPAERIKQFMEEDDQIRVLLDTDADGVADESHVFAKGFNNLVDGTGAGVLEYRGNVYYTCIPSLYLMHDEDGDHQADDRQTLQTGYGIRVAFRGHDLHGLVIGPDGRLYFSIGDRGANIETPDGTLANIESGSVFRCELDGSNFEIFATGLRNPQELAFDNYGNLFTGDNNSDSGDQARWVYVVEDGDSGWRMAYQYLTDRGPFNRERIWEPLHDGQPSFIVPPIANISDGPSGLDFYPGTGFGDLFKDQFFLADFRGTTNKSGIRSIRNEPNGAFFKIAEDKQPFWEILATDFQFGPDGAIYISDWVNGWNGEGKGRIYRFTSDKHGDDALVTEVREFLACDIAEVASKRLRSYLTHADRRVRQKSQLALATRGDFALLADAALNGTTTIEKLHGIWGLDHLTRLKPEVLPDSLAAWTKIASANNIETKAHAVRLLGEFGSQQQEATILKALSDADARVRHFALQAATSLELEAAFPLAVNELVSNAGKDPVLRHAAIMALTATGSPEQIVALKIHESKHLRLGAAVALRRLKSPLIAKFLQDADEEVLAEAARAIHDAPIDAAMPQLAVLISDMSDNQSIVRRVLNANYRIGKADNVASLAAFAADPAHDAAMRMEALDMFANWTDPSGRDRVTGMWRPLASRSATIAKESFASVISEFEDADDSLRLKVGQIATILRLESAEGLLRDLLGDESFSAEDRAEALASLTELGAAQSEDVELALQSKHTALRAGALAVVAKVMPDDCLPILVKAATNGESRERQVALDAFASLGRVAEETLTVLDAWAARKLPNEVALEALELAEAYAEDPRVAKSLAAANADRDNSLPSSVYREAMYGGSVPGGVQVFWEKVAVSCVRCHKIGNDGGEVGPDLTSIGKQKDRLYLLEAIVDPNKEIAKGFESALLLDFDDNVHTGVVREETDDSITLIDAEGRITKFDKDDIVGRNPALSGMPADLMNNLTKRELRDLIAYLASLDGSAAIEAEDEVQ